MTYKLGSLFDGSGGFPLAGSLCGIKPVWASEIEPYPVAVTRSRFPNMKHLGDISKINGAEVEPVDIITFGSPCQDLSVAGKRAGLKHEANGDEETTRSGLFMEAVRIIKEMRKATDGAYPRFALWENVPGAFSSNKGEDFRIVLEELIKIVEPTAAMPAVPKNGWPYADSYCGAGWSLAYRVFDAQHWGVPQRRRRIHLVLDLTAECAREVSFEREGVRGYFETGRTPWQAIAGDAENCSGAADREGVNVIAIDQQGGKGGANYAENVMPTLCSDSHGTPHAVAYSFDSLASNSMKSANPHSGCRRVEVAKTLDTTDPNPSKNQGGIAIVESAPVLQSVPNILLDDQGGQQINVRTDDKCPTLRAEAHGNVPAVVCKTWDARGNGDGDTASTITGDHENRITDYTSVVIEESPVYCLQGNGIDRADTAGCNGKGWTEGACYTLNTIDRPAVAYLASGKDSAGTLMASMATKQCLGDQEAFSGDYHIIEETEPPAVRYIVRRLTPTECARLQGFPDKWGHPDVKEDFTDEEYRFWMEVRNTHATVIGGKEAKDYTKAQMLTWYNKLHTDSAEYKMWGNGIALPPALYLLQGMADVLNRKQQERTEKIL